MSLLWWQNGRDIDWFSANLEKWIKPGGVVSSNPNGSQNHGRYSKLKSCRLSKTCQTMMYIPQEQQPRDLSYEEQLARFQDNRPHKYSQRQEHYNSHYNYIRTSARRAYYKPETHEIVLADEYDKKQTIQRQNRAKNYDYLLLLQQFLRHQQTNANNKGSGEDIGTLTSYLNNNIHQYEQTDQAITLKQFLQEGIQKYEHDNLVTLKDFLQENTKMAVNQNTQHTTRNQKAKEQEDTNKSTKVNDDQKEVTLQASLKEDCQNNDITRTISPTNLFASEIMTRNNRNNPFTTYVCEEHSINNTMDTSEVSIEEVSFDEFLKERQTANYRNEPCQPIIKKSNDTSPRPLHPKVTFAIGDDKTQFEGSNDKLSFDEFLKDRKNGNLQPNIKKANDTSLRPLHPKVKFEFGADTRSQSVDNNDKLSFDEFLKERRHLSSPYKAASEEDKTMTLEEFLQSEPTIRPDQMRLGKSNEHRAKVKNSNNLKLSKSFNDRTNLIKDNLIKKLTRNEIHNENCKKKDSTEENNNENKITLYEFLKEEDQKQTTEIENSLKNLKLRSKHAEGEIFYEINNNAPEIKLNDNIIQVETKTPELKYNQYEHNKQVCACDNQIVLTGKLYNHNYNQLLSSNTSGDKIEFVDKSYDYHRKVYQDNIMSCPIQHRTNNTLVNSTHTQGRRSKSKSKPYIPPVGGIIEEGLYGPMWPSVLLTYDKMVSPNRLAYPNESYA